MMARGNLYTSVLLLIPLLIVSTTAHEHHHEASHDRANDHDHGHHDRQKHECSHGGHTHKHNHNSNNPLVPLALRLSDSLKTLLQPLVDLPVEKAALTASVISSSVSLLSIILLPISSFVTTLLMPFAAGALLSDLVFHLLPHMFQSANANSPMALLASIALFTLLDAVLRRLTSHDHNYHHGDQTPPHQNNENTSTSAVGAYLSLAADGLHNFCDGLTLAAAFTASPTAGIATTIAIILHELPQELADFAMLLRAGFSTPLAILANGLCATTALLGTWIALRISSVASEVAQTMVLPFATGAMLYMTFGSVLPDVVCDLIAPVWVESGQGRKSKAPSPGRIALRAVGGLFSAMAGVTIVAVVEAVHDH